jgi:hypothetical protein
MSKADRSALDAVARHGLMAWIPLGGNVIVEDEGDEAKLKAVVERVQSHRALAVWEIPDEALWNQWYGRLQQLSRERAKLQEMCRQQEAAGQDCRHVRELMDQESQLRARADWAGAEALDRQIRELLGAEAQQAEMQLSHAPEAAEQLRQQLLRGYRILHQLDGRPVWMNYAPRNTIHDMQQYAQAADIVGCDIYPVPSEDSQGHSDLVNQELSCVGDYTDRFTEVGQGRPVWMVLQGFGWRDIIDHAEDAPKDKGRRPTRRESQFMLYDAIVHGARGVLYWGSNYAQEPPEFWQDLRGVVREAADLQPVWAARDAEEQPTVSYLPTMTSVDRPPLALAKQLDGTVYVLVVNEHYDGLGVRLGGLEHCDGAQATLTGGTGDSSLSEDNVQGGTLVLHMPAFSATVVVLERDGRD